MIVKILFHIHLTNKVNCSAKMFLKHVIHTLGLPNYQVKLVFGITKGISELKNSKSSLHLLFYIPRCALQLLPFSCRRSECLISSSFDDFPSFVLKLTKYFVDMVSWIYIIVINTFKRTQSCTLSSFFKRTEMASDL